MIRSKLWKFLRKNIPGEGKGRSKNPKVGVGLKHSGNKKGENTNRNRMATI